jgi:hypothetical protein
VALLMKIEDLTGERMLTAERRWTLLLLGGLCTVFLAAQIQFLDDPYHWDALYYVAASARALYLSPGEIIPNGPWDNGHPPLIFWLLAIVWWAAAPEVWISHLTILFFALAALLLLFALARRLFGARAAFFAVLFLLVNPIFFYHSGTVTVDIPLTAFTLLALLCAVRQRWAAAVAAGCAMVLTRESSALFLPVLAGAAWLLPGRRRRPGPLGPLLLVAIPGLTLAAWFAYHYEVTGWLFYSDRSREVKLPVSELLAQMPYEIYARTLRPFIRGHGQWAATLVAGAALLWNLIRRRRDPQTRQAWLVAGTGVAMVLPIGVATAVMSIFLPRYLLPILPILCVLAGWAVARTGRLAPLAALAVILPLLLAHEGTFRHGWESNRSFLSLLEVNRRSAAWLERNYPDARVLTDWPLWQAVCDPLYGYVRKPIKVMVIGNKEKFTGFCSPGAYVRVPPARAADLGAEDFDLLWLYSPSGLRGRYADLHRRLDLEFVKRVQYGPRSTVFYAPVRAGDPKEAP